MNVTTWTPEDVNKLRDLARGGLTASEIAERLHYSRSAVLGKANREGIRLELTERKLAAMRKRFADVRKRGGRRTRPAADWAGYRTRAKGAPAYRESERLLAVASHLAGMSKSRAAKQVGASALTLRRFWLADAVLVEKARQVVERARAEALAQLAERERARADAAVRIARSNEPILAKFTPRNAEILRRRLNGETLDAIGCDFGVTRERIRQIVQRGIRAGIVAPPGVSLSRDVYGAMQ